MSAALELLHALERDGFRLRRHGARILVSPSDRLTQELRERIRACRPALLGRLLERALGFPVPPASCPVCGGGTFYLRLSDRSWGCASCFPAAAEHAASFHIQASAPRKEDRRGDRNA